MNKIKGKEKKPNFFKRLDSLFTEIAYQLKRNANETESLNKNIIHMTKQGLFGELPLNSTSITLNQSLADMQSSINHLSTEIITQDKLDKELIYMKEYEEFYKNNSDLVDFIELISHNYANMDKFGILDTAKMLNSQYSVAKVTYKIKESKKEVK